VVAAVVAAAVIEFDDTDADADADAGAHTADVANVAALPVRPEQPAAHDAPDPDDDVADDDDDDLNSLPVVFAFEPPYLKQRSSIRVSPFPSFPTRVSSRFPGPPWRPCSHW